MFTPDAAATSAARSPIAPIVYYILWRWRPRHPWHSEELFTRMEAHRRYFSLLQRGYEAYLEKRQRALLPA
jgi:hypothetical protein